MGPGAVPVSEMGEFASDFAVDYRRWMTEHTVLRRAPAFLGEATAIVARIRELRGRD